MESSNYSPDTREQTASDSPYIAAGMEQANVPQPDVDLDYLPYPDAEVQPHTAEWSFLDVLMVHKPSRRENLVTACYVGLAAILGSLCRIMIAQLFGEACKNPGSVGWINAAAPLCVTADGEAVQEGDIVFADLPSNLLGSFLMGLFQDGAVLNLAIPVAIAWLTPHNSFQYMTILHTAIKTGFCGSLTTFSSWNSEMVVMIFGTAKNKSSNIWSAVFGYIIGMETSLGSFVCGKSVARRLHRITNPILAAEAHAMEERREQGVYLNHELPDFERRFLHDLNMGDQYELYPIGRIEALERWRSGTKEVRRVGHHLLPVLLEVERAFLVTNQPVSPEAESIARSEGWDVEALKEWVDSKSGDMGYLPSVSSKEMPDVVPPEDSKWFSLPVASLVLGLVLAGLVVGLVMLNSYEAHMITYRTMVYAMLFAPLGALARWKLSLLNGNCPVQGWEWLPLGTFAANIIGSIVCIAAVAMEYHLESVYPYDVKTFWMIGTLRAVKVGFAGCLTTVSTFVAEVNGFMQRKTDHAYPYILTTILTACLTSVVVYGWIVYLI